MKKAVQKSRRGPSFFQSLWCHRTYGVVGQESVPEYTVSGYPPTGWHMENVIGVIGEHWGTRHSCAKCLKENTVGRFRDRLTGRGWLVVIAAVSTTIYFLAR